MSTPRVRLLPLATLDENQFNKDEASAVEAKPDLHVSIELATDH